MADQFQLDQCPFCTGTDAFVCSGEPYGGFNVTCADCYASTADLETKEAAVERWNTRPTAVKRSSVAVDLTGIIRTNWEKFQAAARQADALTVRLRNEITNSIELAQRLDEALSELEAQGLGHDTNSIRMALAFHESLRNPGDQTFNKWVRIPRVVDLDLHETEPFAGWIVGRSTSADYEELVRIADAVAAGRNPDHD